MLNAPANALDLPLLFWLCHDLATAHDDDSNEW
jgi:hypothetical protein